MDYKKLIVVVFLLRLIIASAYDIFVTITDKDILLPDSKFYSVRGKFASFLLEGYDKASFTKNMLPDDPISKEIFIDTWSTDNRCLPPKFSEISIYFYIIGFIYAMFGHFTIWIRVFNICISLLSVYLLFKVAQRHFGAFAANLFLIVALFLPPQFGYSLTLSRDFLRVFVLSVIVWSIYNLGDIWIKRLKLDF